MIDVLIIGAGAGGCFSAINIAQKYPNKSILILEKSSKSLEKVRISGGGRCNLTHNQNIPSELIKNYPRGGRELLSAFYRFSPKDTMLWFENRGISLKIEEDGRVFPVSNNSMSIVNCLLSELNKFNIEISYKQNVVEIQKDKSNWIITTQQQQQQFRALNLVIATGGNSKMWDMLKQLGLDIVSPVPSLFTFYTEDNFLKDLSGISVNVQAILCNEKLNPLKEKGKILMQSGVIAPLLITHWGVSGPAVLKLSSFGARILAQMNYNFILKINWLIMNESPISTAQAIQELNKIKVLESKKNIANTSIFSLPKRFWVKLIKLSEISEQKKWADLSKKEIVSLANNLTNYKLGVVGKAPFKEEFVTAGGVSLKEIDFKTFKSKKFSNLFFTGEVLDIDAITGGFNFQNAWTGAYILSESIFKNEKI